MQKYDANSWELYYNSPPSKRKESKEKLRARRDSFNSWMIGNARKNARSMRKEPSELEKKMQIFLDNQKVHYEFQKIMYIKKDNGFIQRYYIADFFIPKTGIIIETDGKFHDDQVEQDKLRTKDIQTHCGSYRIVRWRWHDFQSIKKMQCLLKLLKG